jgi:nitrogen fixation protein NifU and related proteins
MIMDTLYQDKILSEYHFPKNYGLKDGFNIETTDSNPLCGDSITVRLKSDGDTVQDVCFESEGCVISKAAASLASEYIKGKGRDVVRSLSAADMMGLLGVTVMPARIKCAGLFLDAVKRVV